MIGIAPHYRPNYSFETSIDHSLVHLDCVGVKRAKAYSGLGIVAEGGFFVKLTLGALFLRNGFLFES